MQSHCSVLEGLTVLQQVPFMRAGCMSGLLTCFLIRAAGRIIGFDPGCVRAPIGETRNRDSSSACASKWNHCGSFWVPPPPHLHGVSQPLSSLSLSLFSRHWFCLPEALSLSHCMPVCQWRPRPRNGTHWPDAPVVFDCRAGRQVRPRHGPQGGRSCWLSSR